MRRVTAISVFVAGAAATALACTVPVFRFALDRWTADKFLLEVPAAWFDSEAGEAFAAQLRASKINYELAASDIAGGKARVSYPQGAELVLWEGELDPVAIMAAANSPAREKVADLITSGESGVWVMVPGEDETKTAALRKRLTERLEFLETVGEIPEQDLSDPDNHLAPGPELRVGFELIEVKRGDPAESLFVKMLASPDGEGLLESGEPFAAAIYGRGRVLGVWGADDLADEGIDEVSLFLLGACSCRVKAQNPGWDLLMGVDWDEKLMAAAMAAELKSEKAE